MRKVFTLFCVAIMLTALVGCGGFAGMGPMGHGSKVALESNNFTVLKTNLKGHAQVMVLFPMNAPFIGKLGLPLGPANLYEMAMKDLRGKVPEKANVGLVNLTVDEKLKHFLVVGWNHVTITADVVKFK